MASHNKITMTEEKISIEIGEDKIAVLSIIPFDGDIDVESLVKIDYSNLLGEILTFPVVFNRIANMRAEMTNQVAHGKLTFDIFEARLTEKKQSTLSADAGKKPSIKDVEVAVLIDPSYSIAKKIFLRKQRDFEYIDALYWSAQSKDKKLNVLSEKITPSEFEKDIVESTINGVMINVRKQVMKSVKK
jgi:hypothetical protein